MPKVGLGIKALSPSGAPGSLCLRRFTQCEQGVQLHLANLKPSNPYSAAWLGGEVRRLSWLFPRGSTEADPEAPQFGADGSSVFLLCAGPAPSLLLGCVKGEANHRVLWSWIGATECQWERPWPPGAQSRDVVLWFFGAVPCSTQRMG